MDKRRFAALVGVLGLTGAAITVVQSAGQAEEPEAKATTAVVWKACPKEVVVPPPSVPQCATVPVPLDYRHPRGRQITIMISKLSSAKPEKRRGILLTNPGGPGGTGLDFPGFLVSKGLPAGVTDTYDVIGVDTRGIGQSAKIGCGFVTTDAYWANVPPYAVNDAAVTSQAKIAKEVAERCAKNNKDGLLQHVTTANMARDMDRIRAALGERKASYFGVSYGSAIGAAYASMFPDTTDRVVLDSIIGDTHLDRDGMRRYAVGFEQTFGDFARWVAARHGTYGLGRTPAEVKKTYFAIAERLDKTPAPDGTTGPMFRFGTFFGLYSEVKYAETARNWQLLLDPAKTPPPPAPKPAPNPQDNQLSVFLAVTCNDYNWPENLDVYRKTVAEDRKRLPMFGAAGANVIPCAYWKYEQYEPPVPTDDDGPANILIVQNQHDPSTPLPAAKLLRKKFADRSKLVVSESSGHGTYVLSDSACVQNATTAYLVDGRMPARDVNCRRI